MADIDLNFNIRGNEPPFNAYLLTGSSIVIDSFSGMSTSGATGFTNVPDVGVYTVKVSDGILNIAEAITALTTTTTTTTTTSTTTIPPDIIYWGFAPIIEPNINDSNTDVVIAQSQTARMWFATDSGYTSGGGTGLALQSSYNLQILKDKIQVKRAHLKQQLLAIMYV